MSKLDFIKKLYNGKNCYSDHMNEDELGFLHIPSGVEQLVSNMLDKHKLVFLTGNPDLYYQGHRGLHSQK